MIDLQFAVLSHQARSFPPQKPDLQWINSPIQKTHMGQHVNLGRMASTLFGQAGQMYLCRASLYNKIMLKQKIFNDTNKMLNLKLQEKHGIRREISCDLYDENCKTRLKILNRHWRKLKTLKWNRQFIQIAMTLCWQALDRSQTYFCWCFQVLLDQEIMKNIIYWE